MADAFEKDTGYIDYQSGIYSALFGTHLPNPLYIARRKRNIENNQTPIYDEMASKNNFDHDIVKILTKEEYIRVVKERRKTFVHVHFQPILSQLFTMLSKDAEQSKVCHREVTFDLPEHFDLEKTEKTLCEYFSDCGYKALSEPRKDGDNRIILTLT